jgi:hypothetical protein
MSTQRLATWTAGLLVVAGAIGWLVSGAIVLGFLALGGILGLAIAFIFRGGPRAVYGPVPESLRAADD